MNAGQYKAYVLFLLFIKYIGDKINTQIIQPLINANDRLGRSDFPNFNDPEKLGEGSGANSGGNWRTSWRGRSDPCVSAATSRFSL